MFFQIKRCYDSHTHFLESGLTNVGVDLHELKDPRDLKNYVISKKDLRGEWLVGFGWDQNKWKNADFPTKEILDELFPNTPVNFTRADGHASWVNSEALKRVGLYNKTEKEFPDPQGGVIVRDSKGYPTGVALDAAKYGLLDLKVPAFTSEQKKIGLQKAIQLFNNEGFTHVRDMSCDLEQWHLLREMDEKGELTLYLEENFTCEHAGDFERVIKVAFEAQNYPSPHLRVAGIKFYYDGALGSEGAFLSQNYAGTTKKGFTMWNLADLKEMMARTWALKLPVAIHTIGDQAVHDISEMVSQMQDQGQTGEINFEHVQVTRPETILLLQKIKARCHMQPCHFLNDKRWLKQKLGSLYQHVFRWEELRLHRIETYWGSDMPIEPCSLKNTFQALQESALDGIPAYHDEIFKPHQHPDVNWGKNCQTIYDEGQVQVVFDGRPLLKARTGDADVLVLK